MPATSLFGPMSGATLLTSIAIATLGSAPTLADPLGYSAPLTTRQSAVDRVIPARMDPLDQQTTPDLPARLRRQIVSYGTSLAPGSIVIDTPNTYLYVVLGGGKAIRYGIGVGREGFTWSGVQTISQKSEWPDWIPPAEMLQRQPYLPRFVAGGPGNPLGARAIYLGNTAYRVHGTNAPETIGKRVSSGCIRMLNEDVIDLYQRVSVGATVTVLAGVSASRPDTMPHEPPMQEATSTAARSPAMGIFALFGLY
jgi:lipoprotein-anchoring transpeptidase ErfK/SrfK